MVISIGTPSLQQADGAEALALEPHVVGPPAHERFDGLRPGVRREVELEAAGAGTPEEGVAHRTADQEALVAGVDEPPRDLLRGRASGSSSGCRRFGTVVIGAILAPGWPTGRNPFRVPFRGLPCVHHAARSLRYRRRDADAVLARVGCGGHAVASFCFDGRAALVWLDPLEPDRGVGAGVLCARHADTLTPPRGWHLQDRRTRTPSLWVDRPTVTDTPLPPRPTVVAPPRIPEPDVAPARVLAPPTDPLPFPTEIAASAAPAEPRHLATADPSNLDELLDARSPLLARAFAAAGSGSEHHACEQ